MVNNTVYYVLVLTFLLFLKKREHKKRMSWNRGFRHLFTLCIRVSGKFYEKPVCFLIFFGYKRILKALFSFLLWLLNFSDLRSYGLNLRKRYTLRLLSKCLGRINSLNVPMNYPQFYFLFNSLRWTPFSLALHLYFS